MSDRAAAGAPTAPDTELADLKRSAEQLGRIRAIKAMIDILADLLDREAALGDPAVEARPKEALH